MYRFLASGLQWEKAKQCKEKIQKGGKRTDHHASSWTTANMPPLLGYSGNISSAVLSIYGQRLWLCALLFYSAASIYRLPLFPFLWFLGCYLGSGIFISVGHSLLCDESHNKDGQQHLFCPLFICTCAGYIVYKLCGIFFNSPDSQRKSSERYAAYSASVHCWIHAD